jgi:hypothetical protein
MHAMVNLAFLKDLLMTAFWAKAANPFFWHNR